MFMKKRELNRQLYDLFWIFIFGCVGGWIVEGIFSYLRYGLLINHSAVVIGPFNMAYGLATLFLTATLVKYKDGSNLQLFCIGFIGGSVLEYIMSWGMELVLGFTAWDYSNMPFNINGRICLLYSFFWGFLAIFWIKIIYPFIIKIINKLNYKLGKKLIIFLIIFLVFDILLTISAIDRARDAEKGIPPSNFYEEFLDQTFNQKYLHNMYNNNWGGK